MDKELTEIAPKNLDGSEVVNTVKKATAEEAEAAAAAEKEKKEDYYVDPLEQETKMKEKLEKIESEKNRKPNFSSEDEEKPEETPDFAPSIRPDMNVTGYFSAGETAKKGNPLARPAGKGAMFFCLIFGIINPICSAFYLILLISGGFNVNWLLNWFYAVIVVITIFILVNSLRSVSAKNDSLRRKAFIGLLGSIISLVPLIAWLVHWISSLF